VIFRRELQRGSERDARIFRTALGQARPRIQAKASSKLSELSSAIRDHAEL